MSIKIDEIVNSIPMLFTYFIPGYITLRIKHNYIDEKDEKDSRLILMSIILSFVIMVFSDAVTDVVMHYNIYISENAKYAIYIIVGCIVGIVMTIYNESKLQKWVNGKFKKRVANTSNVWNCAMKKDEGAWARVYIYEHNLLYIGKIINYTLDPNEEKKEVILSNFKLYRISTKRLIEDNSNKDNHIVLINCTDITNIDIFS